MFTCPVCKIKLIKGKTIFGVLWGCPDCKGKAVGISLLRKTVDKQAVNRIWNAAFDENAPHVKSCPGCEKSMREVAIPYKGDPLVLDVCRQCQFIWFDQGEMETLPDSPPEPKPSDLDEKLPVEVREELAMMQVNRIRKEARDSMEAPEESWKTIVAFFGMPVEFDQNPVSRLPVLTWLLGALIVGVSIYTLRDLQPAIDAYGLLPAEAMRSGGLTFLTSFFLHGGIVHLLGNLYFLLVFGDNVEDYLGSFGYALLILFATLAGGVLHVGFDPRLDIACIGASGGISGIIVFYALQFPHVRVGLLYLFFYRFFWFKMPVYVAALIWLVIQIWGLTNQVQGFTNVSALAHLGGAAVGLIFWIIYRTGMLSKTEISMAVKSGIDN